METLIGFMIIEISGLTLGVLCCRVLGRGSLKDLQVEVDELRKLLTSTEKLLAQQEEITSRGPSTPEAESSLRESSMSTDSSSRTIVDLQNTPSFPMVLRH